MAYQYNVDHISRAYTEDDLHELQFAAWGAKHCIDDHLKKMERVDGNMYAWLLSVSEELSRFEKAAHDARDLQFERELDALMPVSRRKVS